MQGSSSPLKFSLTELLALLLVGGVGLAAMRLGGMTASAGLVVTALLFIALAIAAIVGQGDFRRFAIGFVVAGGIYGALVFYFGERELHPGAGRLPTTNALGPVREAVTTYTYTNVATGETMTAEKAEAAEAAADPDLPPLNFSVTAAPERVAFMSVAHALIGLLLGYAGGKFAVAIGRPSPHSTGRVGS